MGRLLGQELTVHLQPVGGDVQEHQAHAVVEVRGVLAGQHHEQPGGGQAVRDLLGRDANASQQSLTR